MSLLKYSKTWPSILATMAVVQMRVDAKGRPYSSIVEAVDAIDDAPPPVLPTFQKHLNKRCEDERPPHFEFCGPPSPLPRENRNGHYSRRVIPTINVISPHPSTEGVELQPLKPVGSTTTANNSGNGLISGYVPNGGKFCYCSRRRPMLRSDSIKIDNWDYIYTEKQLTDER